VFCARPAGFDEPPFESGPGAKDAHPGIADREIALRREGFHRRALHIDGLQCFRVLRLQRARQASNAGADFSGDFRFRRGVRLEFGRKRPERAAGGLSPSKSVNRGVFQRSIEPRNETIIGRGLTGRSIILTNASCRMSHLAVPANDRRGHSAVVGRNPRRCRESAAPSPPQTRSPRFLSKSAWHVSCRSSTMNDEYRQRTATVLHTGR